MATGTEPLNFFQIAKQWAEEKKKKAFEKDIQQSGVSLDTAMPLGGAVQKQLKSQYEKEQKQQAKEAKEADEYVTKNIRKPILRQEKKGIQEYGKTLDNALLDYNKQIDTYANQLLERGYTQEEVQKNVGIWKKDAETKAGQARQGASQDVQRTIKQIGEAGTLETGVGKFELERAKQVAQKVGGEKVSLPKKISASKPAEYISGGIQTIGKTLEGAEALANMVGFVPKTIAGAMFGSPEQHLKELMTQTQDPAEKERIQEAITGLDQGLVSTASEALSKALPKIADTEYGKAVGSGEGITTGKLGQITGEMAQYAFAPQTAFSRGLGIKAARLARPLGKVGQKILSGGAREVGESLVFDPLIEAANVAGQVKRGEIETPQQAAAQFLMQTAIGVPLGGVAGGAFAGIGAGAKALRKGFKGQPKIKTPEAPALKKIPSEGIKTPEMEAPTIKPLDVEAKKIEQKEPMLAAQTQARYSKITKQATEMGKRTRQIGKEIKKAEAGGDAGLVAKLKAERKQITLQKKGLRKEISDIEKEGLEIRRKTEAQKIKDTPTTTVEPEAVRTRAEAIERQLPEATKKSLAAQPESEVLQTVRKILGEGEAKNLEKLSVQPPLAKAELAQVPKLEPSQQKALKESFPTAEPATIRRADALERIEKRKIDSAGEDLIPTRAQEKIRPSQEIAKTDIKIPQKIESAAPPKRELPEIKDPQTGKASLAPDPRSYSLTKPPEIKDWKEFQEVLRNPKNFKTIEEQAAQQGRKIPSTAQSQIDELANVKKVQNDLKATNDDLAGQIKHLMQKRGLKEVVIDTPKGKRTLKFNETKAEYLSKQGKQLEDQFKQRAFAEGKIKAQLGDDVINVQPAKPGISKAGRGVQTIEQKVQQFFETKDAIKDLMPRELLLKKTIRGEVLKNFDDAGLRNIWRNTEGDTVFHVSKGRHTFDITNIKKELSDYKAELKKQGFSEKRIRQELRETKTRIEELETKKVLETGNIKHPEQIKATINTAIKDIDKAKKGKGLTFGFNPLTGVLALKLLADPDAWVAGLRVFNPFKKFIDKVDSPLLNEAVNAVDGLTGRLKSYSLKLEESKSPALQKLGKEYDDLAGRELFAEGYLRTSLGKEQVDKIAEALKEETVTDLLKRIERGDPVEGIENVEQLELVKAFLGAKQRRAVLIQDAIRAADADSAVTAQEKNLLKKFLDHETAKVKNGALVSFVQDTAYGIALMNRLGAAGLAATDPFLKLIPEFGVRNLFKGIVKIADVKGARNSPLFKAFNAGDSGNMYDAIRGAKGKMKVAEEFKKKDIFSFMTDSTQDIGLFTHAKAFDEHWFKTTGKKVDIINDFDKNPEAALEFSLLHNDILNRWYGTGKGVIHKNMLESSPAIKPMLAFLSEPGRFQMNVSRWGSRIKRGMVKGASEADKQAGKAATKSLINFVAVGTVLGGAGFIKNLGGSLGSAYNLAFNQLSPKQQQQTEDMLNSVQLARYIGVDLGEKLGVDFIGRGDAENFVERLSGAFKGENKNMVFDLVKRVPRTTMKAMEQWDAGNKGDAIFTLAKGLLPSVSGVATSAEKAIKKYKGEPISVWLNDGGQLTEIPKEVDWADVFSYSASGADKLKSVEKQKRAVEEVSESFNFQKFGKRTKAVPKDEKAQKRLNEYVDLLHQDRYQLAINKKDQLSKTEIKELIFKKAEQKQKTKERKIAKRKTILAPERLLAQPEAKSLPALRLKYDKSPEEVLEVLEEARLIAIKKRDRAAIKKIIGLRYKLQGGITKRKKMKFVEQELVPTTRDNLMMI